MLHRERTSSKQPVFVVVASSAMIMRGLFPDVALVQRFGSFLLLKNEDYPYCWWNGVRLFYPVSPRKMLYIGFSGNEAHLEHPAWEKKEVRKICFTSVHPQYWYPEIFITFQKIHHKKNRYVLSKSKSLVWLEGFLPLSCTAFRSSIQKSMRTQSTKFKITAFALE